MTLDRHLVSHGHFHRFIVTSALGGWEVREEKDFAVLRRAHRQDWHRVESDIHLFEIRALALKCEGWVENVEERPFVATARLQLSCMS